MIKTGIPPILARNLADKFIRDSPPYPECHGSYDSRHNYCYSNCPYRISCREKQKREKENEIERKKIEGKIRFKKSLLHSADDDAKERILADIKELEKQTTRVGRIRTWGKRLPQARSQEEKDKAREEAREEARIKKEKEDAPISYLEGIILSLIGSFIITYILCAIVAIVVNVGSIGFIIVFIIILVRMLIDVFKQQQEKKKKF